jgi:hypothetical protein
LLDGEEVRHLVYDANGNPTTTWVGGWQVTINSSSPFPVWVSSDPNNADSDNDGISDQAEKALAANPTPANRIDNTGVPYHPNVVNIPPLTILTDVNDFDRFVKPGQSFLYTTTVIANVAVVPGVLNLTVPSVAGSAPTAQTLSFNPSAAVPQTAAVANGFTINSGAPTGSIVFTSTVNTRLAASSAAGWTFDTVSPQTIANSFTTPTLARGTTVAASLADRQDSFRLAAKLSTAAALTGTGDIFSIRPPSVAASLLDEDDNRIIRRGATDPDMACNNAGDCMVVWDEVELLGNGEVTEVPYRNGTSFSNGFVGDMSSPNDILIPINFNGDGKDDILYYRRGSAYAGIYRSSSNGNGTLNYLALNDTGNVQNGFLADIPTDARDVLVPLDINGDGYDDILFYRPGGRTAGIFRNNGNETFTYLTYRNGDTSANGFVGDLSNAADSLQPMDVNGDGKDDLLYSRPGGGDAGVYLADPDNTTLEGQLKYVPYAVGGSTSNGFVSDMLNASDRLVPLDMNGDGKDDIFYARPGGRFAGVYLANSNGNGTLTYKTYAAGGSTSNGWYPDMSSPYDISIPLDINGDGKDDIFFARLGGGFAGVHLSNGDGAVTYVPYRDGNTHALANGWVSDVSSLEDRFVPVDQNGDGKDDLLFYRRIPSGGEAGIHLANPQGDGSVKFVSYRSSQGNSNGFTGDVASTADNASPIDLNGDGRQDFLWLRPGSGVAAAFLTVSNTPSYRIGGALVGANNAIKQRLTFPRRNPAPLQHAARDRHPQVASNGDGFLVTYETVAPSLNNTHYVVVEGFDKHGATVGNHVQSVGDVPRGVDRSLDNDLAWMGDRYRLAMKGRGLANIYVGDFNPNASTLTNLTQVASNGLIATGTSTIDTTPSLAWDPTTGRWALTYIRGTENNPTSVQINRYPNVASTTADANTTFISAYERVTLVWHPQSRGWLFQGQLTDNRQVFSALAANLQGLTGDLGTSTQIGWVAADVPSSALACPVVTSLPVLDLSFEELPGATTFVDSSGFGNNAVCGSPTQCPTAAVPGAPGAPLSDYGLGFNGNQFLRVADIATFDYDESESFTWMAWIKPNESSPILRKGIGGSADLMLSINSTGRLQMGFGNVTSNTLSGGPDLRNNGWHHVAVTLNRTTNTATLYVDGVSLNSGTFTGNFTTADDLFIGSGNTAGYNGQLDHLQFFNTALAPATVAAIYDRSQQSYCVATNASSTGANIQWAKLLVTQNDTRGGTLSASGGLELTVDSDKPTAAITTVSNDAPVGTGQVIAGTASDPTSGVAYVEVSTDNGVSWQPAAGTNVWSFSLAGLTGAISLQVRAVDLVGNVGTISAPLNLTVDATPPTVTVNPVAGTVKPTQQANGQWQVALTGTATDSGSGVKPNSVLVDLQAVSGIRQTQQAATLSGNTWSLTYLLDASYSDPTGSYTVTVRAEDNIGNRAAPATTVVRLDAMGPTARLNAVDASRPVITQTLTIGGVVSDTNSIAGIDKLEIAFTPVDQIAALPPGLTGAEAEAQLNRTWAPVSLVARGAGVATTTWSLPIPTGLENIYQIDLRATDMLGNVLISSGVWRGMIDTLDPRVVMTATATGASYLDATQTRRYEVRYLCAAADRNLNEASFTCPGKGVAEPVRSFTNIPSLQTLFPDLALRTGLAISYTRWITAPAPTVTAAACDSLDHCAQQSTTVPLTPPTSTAPKALVIAPTAGSYVAAADGKVNVVVAAEAASGLQEVTLLLDGTVVNTASFAQADNIQTQQRTVEVTVASEGMHTLTAQATDWANGTQTTDFPVQFTLDKNLPTVSIADVEISAADTWAMGSGILRFGGTAGGSVALAAVKVRVGQRAWLDANFANGQWQIAYPVPDPEGQTLTVVARAIDKAGQISEVTKEVPVNFTVPIPPDTTISSGPVNPSPALTASFVFTGTGGTNSLAVFECKLDTAAYVPCASPYGLSDLSSGAHTLLVRSIDSRGFVDPTPANYSWTVNAAAPTLTGYPAATTTARTATFTFTGGSSFECRLDEGAFTACTSPQSYTGLIDGEHLFLVRNPGGAATRYSWTVTNAAPMAATQTVTTLEETPVAIPLTAVDEDTPLEWRIVDPPRHGALSGVAPHLTYQPDTAFTGDDSFTFQVSDGQARSAATTVTIAVRPRNQPPTTAITVQPTNPSGPEVSFVFTGTDDVAVTAFECSLDSAAFTACTSPQAYSGLALGTHTFQVRAVDTAVVADPNPARYDWEVQTVVGVCDTITVYQSASGQYTAPGWSGAILVGTAAANTLNGGSGRDLLLGLGGNDKLDGKDGEDLLCGGDGVDQLLGGLGNDYLNGGAGNDVLNSGTGDYDRMIGGDGNDTLLDGDGVAEARGGAGNDGFTIALRNGWLYPQGQTSFDGLTAGYGNDTVGLANLGTTAIKLDISGDERDTPPSPLEGTTDALTRAGLFTADSTIIKFERQTVNAASAEGAPLNFEGFLVDPTTLTDESGAEFLEEPVGGEGGEAGSSTQLFLPLISQ